MKKISLILFAIFFYQFTYADNVNSFSISSANLVNGNVKVFTTGNTSITMDLNFFRNLNSLGAYENANINYQLVAYYPGGSSGLPVITNLSPAYNVKTSDFTTSSPNFVARTHTFDITYAQVQNNVKIA